MAKCPKCGQQTPTPTKTWTVFAKKGETTPMTMGIFECQNCKTKFRTLIQAKIATEETASIKNMVERIKGIKGELMQTLKNLREKIKTLETERANLMIEIDNLKKVAESRATALETEVTMLREEVNSLRDLLGYKEEIEK